MIYTHIYIRPHFDITTISEPKKDVGGNTRRPKMGGQTKSRQPASQSSQKTPRVGPGAPLPAIPTGKHAFTA